MSLDWNLSKVENRAEVCYQSDGRLTSVTEAVIWTTRLVDMGSITAKNYKEFAARAQIMAEQFDAAVIVESSGLVACGTWRRGITEDEARMHIGLTTNVITKSAKAWAARIAKIAAQKAIRDLRRSLVRSVDLSSCEPLAK